MLQKDPSKRPSIKNVLEDPWLKKYNATKIIEKRRKSRELSTCDFQVYTTFDEQNIK